MKFRHFVVTFAVCVAAAGVQAAFSQDAAPSTGDKPNADAARRGKALYAAHCSHCHGFDMVTAGTVTYDLREFPRNQEQRFFDSVTNGKRGRMPPWGDQLTQEEIGDIWAYVHTGGKL